MNMRWRLNSCRAYRENVSLLASGALPEAEQTSVRAHLAHCAPCRQYYEEMARLSGQFEHWARTEPQVPAGAAFRARWMRSIESANSPTQILLRRLISKLSAWLWPSPVAWGALAAVWVTIGHSISNATESLERPAEVTTLLGNETRFAGRKAGSRNLSSEIFSLPSGFVRHWAPHWDTHGASEAWERD